MILKKIAILVFILMLPTHMAHARIDILPKRIVLEPRERSAEITILNMFEDPSVYRLSIIHYKQNSDGTYEPLEQPLSPDFDPNKHIRMSPKQFRVEPAGRQKIRLSVRRPADLPDGEYRFHIIAKRFETEENKVDTAKKGVGINMKMNVAVAIPVVIRQGNLTVETQIGDVIYIPASQSNNKRNELSVTVARNGSASSIGRLEVLQGDELIGQVDNFNIFEEINTRTIFMPLRKDPRGGAIRVIYEDNNGEIFDEKSVQP